jgi:LPXTG-motif cell wall-anchored protein
VIGQEKTVDSTGSSSTGASEPAGSSSPTTSGESGIGSGNQTAVDAQVPVNATGNQVTVIGQDNTVDSAGSSSTSGPATSGPATSGSATTTGEDGLVSGNQTGIAVLAPIDASGNQVTVIGQDNTVDSTGSSSTSGPAPSGSATTTGDDGLLSGNQTGIAVLAPIDLSGNQVTVIGQDNTDTSSATSTAGSTSGGSGDTTTGGATTSGEDGVVSGNQTGIAVLAPIDATGNQVTVVGQDNTVTSTGGSTTGGGTPGTETTTGTDGVGSGNQTPVVVDAPVDTSGNQVTVVGQDNTTSSTSTSTTGGGTTSPPGGTVVSPPATGSNGGTPSVVSSPGTSGLPNTGLPSGTGLFLLLGLLLVAGGALGVRRGLVQTR